MLALDSGHQKVGDLVKCLFQECQSHLHFSDQNQYSGVNLFAYNQYDFDHKTCSITVSDDKEGKKWPGILRGLLTFGWELNFSFLLI